MVDVFPDGERPDGDRDYKVDDPQDADDDYDPQLVEGQGLCTLPAVESQDCVEDCVESKVGEGVGHDVPVIKVWLF